MVPYAKPDFQACILIHNLIELISTLRLSSVLQSCKINTFLIQFIFIKILIQGIVGWNGIGIGKFYIIETRLLYVCL